MRRASLSVMAGLILLAGVAVTAFGEEGPGAQGGPGMGQRRLGPQRQGPGGRGRQMLRRRMQARRRLLNTDEGKALREEFRKKIEALHAEGKAIHDAIRKAIQGGQKPQEAFQEHVDELKALMKKRILAGIEFREKLLALARQNVDKAVEKMHQKLRERARERRRGPEGMRKGGLGEQNGPGGPDERRRRFDDFRRRRPEPEEDDIY